MPNGHGGFPWMGGPLLLALAAAIVAALPAAVRDRFGWSWAGACLALVGLAGWRLAYHLHMWGADEYGGAYTSPEKYRRAALRYYGFAAAYALLAMGAAFGVLWWRGLP
jgi:hypothetical protein